MDWDEAVEHRFRREILTTLYKQWFEGNKSPEFNPREYLEQHSLNQEEGLRVIREMEEEGLINIFNFYSISPTGFAVKEAENQGLVEPSIVEQARNLQTGLVLSLDKQKDPVLVEDKYFNHAWFLECWGSVKTEMIPMHASLTPQGRTQVQRIKKLRSRVDRFEHIEGRNPQVRGLDFQRFIKEMLDEEEWNPENTRSEGEEIDVVFNRGLSYYLLESKWESDPIEPNAIRDFAGKLGERIAGTIGCFVSMSGFTDAAVQWAKQQLSKNQVILLFGAQDIEGWITGRTTFENLLAKKLDVAVKQRKLEYE